MTKNDRMDVSESKYIIYLFVIYFYVTFSNSNYIPRSVYWEIMRTDAVVVKLEVLFLNFHVWPGKKHDKPQDFPGRHSNQALSFESNYIGTD
jgi:hypothetical protein